MSRDRGPVFLESEYDLLLKVSRKNHVYIKSISKVADLRQIRLKFGMLEFSDPGPRPGLGPDL